MKNFIYLLSFLLFPLTILSQQVTIKGNKFYMNESEFYPVCVHYHTEGFKNTPDTNNNNIFELLYSPVHSYNLTYKFECSSYQGCFDQIQTDFNYISNMGFNTVRIGVAPQYNPEVGLFMSYIVPGQTYPYQPFIDIINLDDPSDPALLRLLNFTESILHCANNTQPNPLKIILLVKGDITALSSEEITLRTSFLDKLSYFISQSTNQNALLAYDLINEPYYHIVQDPNELNSPHRYISKAAVCDIVSTWFNTIKNNAPNHLITLGSGGDWDIFDWDISLLKLDFVSLHYYPSKKNSEDNSLPSTQSLMRMRTLNRLFWLNNNSLRPWIIGETGFTSNETGVTENGIFHPFAWYPLNLFDGTNLDLADYVDFSLKSTCGCGGSGYTWFCYQDVDFAECGEEYFNGNFFGLVKRYVLPSPIAEKQPALDFIRYYNPVYDNFCPVDYSPNYDSTKLYYNPNGFSSSITKQVYGYVKDSNGNPIKDAVISAHDNNWKTITTFSDENGFYRIIPDQSTFNNVKIIDITVTAIGAEIEFISDESNGLNGSKNFSLNQVHFDKTLSNIVITPSSNLLYEAPRLLNLINVDIINLSSPSFYATKEIIISSGFYSEIGTNSHFKIQNVFIDCSLINN